MPKPFSQWTIDAQMRELARLKRRRESLYRLYKGKGVNKVLDADEYLRAKKELDTLIVNLETGKERPKPMAEILGKRPPTEEEQKQLDVKLLGGIPGTLKPPYGPPQKGPVDIPKELFKTAYKTYKIPGEAQAEIGELIELAKEGGSTEAALAEAGFQFARPYYGWMESGMLGAAEEMMPKGVGGLDRPGYMAPWGFVKGAVKGIPFDFEQSGRGLMQLISAAPEHAIKSATLGVTPGIPVPESLTQRQIFDVTAKTVGMPTEEEYKERYEPGGEQEGIGDPWAYWEETPGEYRAAAMSTMLAGAAFGPPWKIPAPLTKIPFTQIPIAGKFAGLSIVDLVTPSVRRMFGRKGQAIADMELKVNNTLRAETKARQMNALEAWKESEGAKLDGKVYKRLRKAIEKDPRNNPVPLHEELLVSEQYARGMEAGEAGGSFAKMERDAQAKGLYEGPRLKEQVPEMPRPSEIYAMEHEPVYTKTPRYPWQERYEYRSLQPKTYKLADESLFTDPRPKGEYYMDPELGRALEEGAARGKYELIPGKGALRMKDLRDDVMSGRGGPFDYIGGPKSRFLDEPGGHVRVKVQRKIYDENGEWKTSRDAMEHEVIPAGGEGELINAMWDSIRRKDGIHFKADDYVVKLEPTNYMEASKLTTREARRVEGKLRKVRKKLAQVGAELHATDIEAITEARTLKRLANTAGKVIKDFRREIGRPLPEGKVIPETKLHRNVRKQISTIRERIQKLPTKDASKVALNKKLDRLVESERKMAKAQAEKEAKRTQRHVEGLKKKYDRVVAKLDSLLEGLPEKSPRLDIHKNSLKKYVAEVADDFMRFDWYLKEGLDRAQMAKAEMLRARGSIADHSKLETPDATIADHIEYMGEAKAVEQGLDFGAKPLWFSEQFRQPIEFLNQSVMMDGLMNEMLGRPGFRRGDKEAGRAKRRIFHRSDMVKRKAEKMNEDFNAEFERDVLSEFPRGERKLGGFLMEQNWERIDRYLKEPGVSKKAKDAMAQMRDDYLAGKRPDIVRAMQKWDELTNKWWQTIKNEVPALPWLGKIDRYFMRFVDRKAEQSYLTGLIEMLEKKIESGQKLTAAEKQQLTGAKGSIDNLTQFVPEGTVFSENAYKKLPKDVVRAPNWRARIQELPRHSPDMTKVVPTYLNIMKNYIVRNQIGKLIREEIAPFGKVDVGWNGVFQDFMTLHLGGRPKTDATLTKALQTEFSKVRGAKKAYGSFENMARNAVEVIKEIQMVRLLGLDMANAVVNATQFMNTISYLGAKRFGQGVARAGDRELMAHRERINLAGEVPWTEQDLYLGSAAGKAIHGVSSTLMLPFRVGERGTRIFTDAAAYMEGQAILKEYIRTGRVPERSNPLYDMMKKSLPDAVRKGKKGMRDWNDAFAAAHEEALMHDYSRSNLPPVVQKHPALLGIPYQFKTFLLSQLNLLMKNMTPKQAARFVGYTMAIVGPGAIPFFQDILAMEQSAEFRNKVAAWEEKYPSLMKMTGAEVYGGVPLNPFGGKWYKAVVGPFHSNWYETAKMFMEAGSAAKHANPDVAEDAWWETMSQQGAIRDMPDPNDPTAPTRPVTGAALAEQGLTLLPGTKIPIPSPVGPTGDVTWPTLEHPWLPSRPRKRFIQALQAEETGALRTKRGRSIAPVGDIPSPWIYAAGLDPTLRDVFDVKKQLERDITEPKEAESWAVQRAIKKFPLAGPDEIHQYLKEERGFFKPASEIATSMEGAATDQWQKQIQEDPTKAEQILVDRFGEEWVQQNHPEVYELMAQQELEDKRDRAARGEKMKFNVKNITRAALVAGMKLGSYTNQDMSLDFYRVQKKFAEYYEANRNVNEASQMVMDKGVKGASGKNLIHEFRLAKRNKLLDFWFPLWAQQIDNGLLSSRRAEESRRAAKRRRR